MIKEYLGKVENTFHDTSHNIYHLDVKIGNELYKLEFKHFRAYVADNGDIIRFKGILDIDTKKVMNLEELWVKLK